MKREFQVGDICRIRSWEDMQREFGMDDSILCDFVFIPEMSYLCGKQFTIAKMEQRSLGTLCISSEGVEGIYNIGTDMLELVVPAESPTFKAADMDTLLACLG